jgi:hypothetical protein
MIGYRKTIEKVEYKEGNYKILANEGKKMNDKSKENCV